MVSTDLTLLTWSRNLSQALPLCFTPAIRGPMQALLWKHSLNNTALTTCVSGCLSPQQAEECPPSEN